MGKHKCKIVGVYGNNEPQTEVFTGQTYVDAIWASTLHIEPFANTGFNCNEKQVDVTVGPKEHSIVFTFTEIPEGEKPPEFDDGADTEKPSQLDQMQYQINELVKMVQVLLSQSA